MIDDACLTLDSRVRDNFFSILIQDYPFKHLTLCLRDVKNVRQTGQRDFSKISETRIDDIRDTVYKGSSCSRVRACVRACGKEFGCFRYSAVYRTAYRSRLSPMR